MSDKIIEPTAAQKLAGNIAAGGYVVLCGAFLLAVGLGAIDGVTVTSVLLPSIFYALALAFITSACIQKNSVSMWIGAAFAVPATITVLNNFTSLTYAQLYPLYIAIPAIASAAALVFSETFKDNLKAIAFFGSLALVFALQSSGLVGWQVVGPALVVFAGAAVIIEAVKGRKNGEEDDE